MKNKKIILASNSKRRKEILEKCGFTMTHIVSPKFKETIPPNIPAESLPLYMAKEKMRTTYFSQTKTPILTADTLVILNQKILTKPNSKTEAITMLTNLSNQKHTVITACSIKKENKLKTIQDKATVYFKKLTPEEIEFYVTTYNPLDKAGAYGIQEYMGMIGIKRITGSFYTIMGLPIHKLYPLLLS